MTRTWLVPAQELAALTGMRDMSQALAMYTERHYKRMGRLLQSTFVLDFLLQGMHVYAADEPADTARAHGSAVYLQGTAAAPVAQGAAASPAEEAMNSLAAAQNVPGAPDVQQSRVDYLIAEALAAEPAVALDTTHVDEAGAGASDQHDWNDAGSLPGWGDASEQAEGGEADAKQTGDPLCAALAMGPQPSSKLKRKRKRHRANGAAPLDESDAVADGAHDDVHRTGEAETVQVGAGEGLGVLAPRPTHVANGAVADAQRKGSKKRHSAPSVPEAARRHAAEQHEPVNGVQPAKAIKSSGKRRRRSEDSSPAADAVKQGKKRRKSIA